MGTHVPQPSVLRSILRFAASFSLALVTAALFSAPLFAQRGILHDPRRKTFVGFSADLLLPADQLDTIVQRVAADGTIRGTHVFAKDREIDGADPAKSSKAFADTFADAKTFYKVKEGAISPASFPGSNDIGTITVRYVVQPLSPQKARLRIDAIFIADRGLRCPSDGGVEAAEYGEILDQVKAFLSPPVSRLSGSKPTTAATVGLQATLAQEQERLADVQSKVTTLEQREKQLEFNTMGRIRSSGASLKASPYSHASNVALLDKSEKVTVLVSTKYWYRIRRNDGTEGWLYYVFLEALSP
jgi:hypothetical protein